MPGPGTALGSTSHRSPPLAITGARAGDGRYQVIYLKWKIPAWRKRPRPLSHATPSRDYGRKR